MPDETKGKGKQLELPENFGKVDFEKMKATLNLKKHMKFKRLLEWITEEDKNETN